MKRRKKKEKIRVFVAISRIVSILEQKEKNKIKKFLDIKKSLIIKGKNEIMLVFVAISGNIKGKR